MRLTGDSAQHRTQEVAKALRGIVALAEGVMRDLDLDPIGTGDVQRRTDRNPGDEEFGKEHEVLFKQSNDLQQELGREHEVLRKQNNELRQEICELQTQLARLGDRHSKLPSRVVSCPYDQVVPSAKKKTFVRDVTHSMMQPAEQDEWSPNNKTERETSEPSDQGHIPEVKDDLRSVFVFNEGHPAVVNFFVLISFVIVLTVWSDTLAVAQDWNADEHGPLGWVWEQVALVLFSLDMLMNFNVTYEDSRGHTVANRCAIAKRYCKSWFLIDLLTTVPWAQILRDSVGSLSRTGKMLKFLKIIRILKLMRLTQSADSELGSWLAMNFIDELLAWMGLPDGMLDFALHCLRFIYGVSQLCTLIFVQGHILSCILLGYANGGTLSWQYDRSEPTIFDPWLRYVITMRWSIAACLVGTATDSDLKIIGVSVGSETFQTMVMTWNASNLLLVLVIFSGINRSDSNESYQIRYLDLFLAKHKAVSAFSRKSAVAFLLSEMRMNHDKATAKTISSLPHDLKHHLVCEMYTDTISSFTIFQQGPFKACSYSHGIVSRLCGLVENRCYRAGHLVISKSTVFESMCFVQSGTLIRTSTEREDIAHSTRTRTALVRKGGLIWDDAHVLKFVGIETLFAPDTPYWQHAPFSVMASTYCTILVLQRRHFETAIASNPAQVSFTQFIRQAVAEHQVSIHSLHMGLSQDIYDEFAEKWRSIDQEEQEDSITRSERLGVSVDYLLLHFKNDLLEDMREAQPAIEREPTSIGSMTFEDLAKKFWLDQHAGFKGSAGHICPRDGLTGSSIVDALDGESAGQATQYVSWCWKYTVNMMLSALGLWAQAHEMDHSTAFLWICFFCNNQRRLLVNKEEHASFNLADTFEARLQKIGHVIIVLDTYQNSLYTTRIWCVYETFEATKRDLRIDISLPSEVRREFHTKLEIGRFQEIVDSLQTVDVESATATVAADEVAIKSLIRSSIGFQAVNRTVQFALVRWLASAFQDCLTSRSISSVTAHVFKLIKHREEAPAMCKRDSIASVSHMDFLETPANLGNVTFDEFEVVASCHPSLLDFLEVDGDLLEAFQTLDLDAEGTLSIGALERHIRIKGKSDLQDFLASPLCQSTSDDPILEEICKEAKADFRRSIQLHEKQNERGRRFLQQLSFMQEDDDNEDEGGTQVVAFRGSAVMSI